MALVPAFVEVVRQGSFTAAAEVLGLPKSTVSRRVSRLEEQLGAELLIRTTRKLRLTEAGEAFHARVAPAVERVEEAARLVAERQEEPRGLLRVTVPVDIEWLPGLFVRFCERYPDVEVEVSVTGRTVDLVGEGFDAAIRAGRLEDSSLIARRLVKVSFHFFASCEYLEREGEPEALEDLADHRCVVFRPHQGVGRAVVITPDGRRTVELAGQLMTDDILFARAAVIAGAGIGLLPEGILGDRRERVRRVLPDVHTPGGDVHLVYPSTAHLPAKVRAFRDFLLEAVEAGGFLPASRGRR